MTKIFHYLESHNLELDLDLAGDLAMLKKNLARMRKGRFGKGLQDLALPMVKQFIEGFNRQALCQL